MKRNGCAGLLVAAGVVFGHGLLVMLAGSRWGWPVAGGALAMLLAGLGLWWRHSRPWAKARRRAARSFVTQQQASRQHLGLKLMEYHARHQPKGKRVSNVAVKRWLALWAAKWRMRDVGARVELRRQSYGLRCEIISRHGQGTIHWDGWRMRFSPGTARWGDEPRRWH